MEQILIVDDEREIADVVELYLQNEYKVLKFYTGKEALECIDSTRIDLAILDVMLPDIDGFTILKKIREKYTFPVLMLTALGRVGDRVDGLDAGADDYLTKPFDTRELLARLRALVRRPADLTGAAPRLACGDLTLDTAQLTLTGPAATVTVSRRECDLLAVFCRAPGLLRGRALLLGSVWGADAGVEDASLDSYIRFVRRRLAAVGSRAVIRTVRGAGYRLDPGGAPGEAGHA